MIRHPVGIGIDTRRHRAGQTCFGGQGCIDISEDHRTCQYVGRLQSCNTQHLGHILGIVDSRVTVELDRLDRNSVQGHRNLRESHHQR